MPTLPKFDANPEEPPRSLAVHNMLREMLNPGET